MTKDEWLIDFQVANGRKPTEVEFDEAFKRGFPPVTHTSSKMKKDPQLLLKVACGLVVAVFGYVVGYLFM